MKMSFPYLISDRVNLHSLQTTAARELFDLLNKINGRKFLVLDEGLMGPIGLLISTSMFSECGIKLLKLDKNPLTHWTKDNEAHFIYLVRPKAHQMNLIVEQVNQSTDNGKNMVLKGRFHIYFVPRRSQMCINHLRSKEVYEIFGLLEELAWNFYPLDNDVLSMEVADAYRDAVMDKDPTILYQAAMGLVQLQYHYGRIPKIYGKGQLAQDVWDRAKQLGAEEKLLSNVDKGVIDQLILLDRSIDFVSMFATQLTYEGLIDEFYGIHQNRLTLSNDPLISRRDGSQDSPQQKLEPSSSTGGGNVVAHKKTILLHSEQKLYAELRDKNFNEVGKILALNAKNICQQMNTPNTEETTVQDMRRLVDRLPDLLAQKQSVALHTNIAESIRTMLDAPEFNDDLTIEQEFMMCEDVDKANFHIENLIAKKTDLIHVLRLICMQCAAASGFKSKVLNYYKRELVHVYGIETLLMINNLERAGVLYVQGSGGSPYSSLRKLLKLTVDEAIEVNPKDVSYVHSFYAPLTIRLIEQSIKPIGWQTLKGALNQIPGPTVEDFQTKLIGIDGRHHLTVPAEGSLQNVPRVVMVFFIGGCTYAEISALRFLAKQEDTNVRFLIATTKVLNKHSFLKTML